MFEDWTNCQVCEYNPTGDKCELFGRVIGMHGCSSGVERKPRNHFEEIKNMNMEGMAEWLDLVRNNKDYPIYATDWTEWLKEAIADG